MKKILSLLMIMLILFSVCSCDSKPQNDEVATPVIDVEPEIEKEDTETYKQTDKTEQTPKPQPKPEPQPEPEPEPEQTDSDKEKNEVFTLDNVFSPYEVVITLTVEESEKGLTYTPEDFPEIDCYYIYPYNYYPEVYRPEYKDNYTIALMLNEPSKENVLKYVEIAKQDPRVHSACPNALEPIANSLVVCIDEREDEYTILDFEGDEIYYVTDDYHSKGYQHDYLYYLIDDTRRIHISYDTQDRKQIITKLANDPRIHYIMPSFSWFEEDMLFINITDEAQKAKEEYTAADFGLEDIATLTKPYTSILPKGYHVVLNKPSKQTIVDLKKTLKQDPRIEYVDIYPIGYLVM